MNGPVLVAALGTPLLGAVAAALVPSGRHRASERRGWRRRGPTTPDGADADDADDEIALIVALPEPEPAPLADGSEVERAGVAARTVVRLAALAAAALWIVVALLGEARAGLFTATGAVAPAGAGCALALSAVCRPARKGPACAGAVALALVTAGLAAMAGERSATSTVAVLVLGAGVGVAALATAKEGDGGLGPLCLALLGMAAVAAGLAQRPAVDSLTPAGSTPAALLVVAGGALVAVAGGLRARRSGAVLLPVGLAVGVAGATTLGAAGGAVALLLAAGAAAAAVGAWAAAPDSTTCARLVVVTIALLALAVAAVPATGLVDTGSALDGVPPAAAPAAWFLASAAVLTSVVLVPLGALSVLPGAAAFAGMVAVDPEPVVLGVAGLAVAAAVAAVVAVQRWPASAEASDAETGQLASSPLVAGVPALVVAAWVLVAPRSWSWVGDAHLATWPDSIALALAGGLVVVVAAAAAGRVALPRPPRFAAPDPVATAADGRVARRAAMGAGAVLGVALLALVVAGGGNG